MQEDEGLVFVKARQGVARGQGKTQRPANGCTKSFGKLKVAFDGVGATIDPRNVMINESRTFARITHSENLARTAGASDEGAAQQTLKIERRVRSQQSRFLRPAEQVCRKLKAAAQFVAWKNVNVIDVAIAAQERRPLGIDHPRDLRCRVGITDGGDGGQSMDDVA